jgi:dihydropteroate synthase
MRLTLGDRHHDVTQRALVMGVVGGARGQSGDRSKDHVDALVRRAEELVGEGADLLEVRDPVAQGARGAEEVDDLVAAVEALHRCVDVPLACRTSSGAAVRAACAAGAVVVDDSGGFADPDLLPAVLEAQATLVVRPGRSGPGAGSGRSIETDVVTAAATSLADAAGLAERAGLAATRIVLDPALDQAGSWAQSLLLLRSSCALAALGYPLLLATTDIAFPADLLGPAADRSQAADAAHALGIIGGCRLLRTTDVRGARRVADVLAAVLAGGAPEEGAVHG